ncbi:hypothetical protein [Actinoplanes sp. NPDC051851]|uniref:hypothetical protein n=1 Tax=Actinoplanes sp. NPDC051851 TaxID=3154753 RepID=UPI003437119E
MPHRHDPLEPAAAATMEELVALLRRLHARAGKPSLRDLEAWAIRQQRAGRRDVLLKRTTISEVLSGKRAPGRNFVGWFAEACGVPDGDAVRAWLRAWEVAAERPAPAGREDGEALRRIRELTEENARLRRKLWRLQTRRHTRRLSSP